jgi:hypothetical protein
MSWLGRLFGQKQRDIRLIGTWYSDPSDADSHNAYGQAEMQFEPDGKLTYTLFEQDGRAGIMNLTWDTDGGMVHTDQPSHPDRQSSLYEVSLDGVLTISFGGEPATFIRKS